MDGLIAMEVTLIIGGAGFLGAALASELKKRGVSVRVFDLLPHPDPSIPTHIGDLRDKAQVREACTGVDTVFQTASLVDWGSRSRDRLYAVNVKGNRNVISVCQELGVPKLVYTSSIDVVFDGHPVANGDESLPYPANHLDHYGHSKMLAEQEVLAANGQHGLRTCALRTAGIYGPGDRHRLPSILKAARSGQNIRLGDGSAKFGHVYVTNVVHAHILAAQALDGPAAGQAYFIGDHPPGNFFDFFTPYLAAFGFPPAKTSIPYRVAYMLAILMETVARLGIGPSTPTLTRYVVASTCVDFYFSHDKAKRELGYQPVVSLEQAQAETLAWLRADIK
jgi:nucleoside-diphosphate-sugar epimerase